MKARRVLTVLAPVALGVAVLAGASPATAANTPPPSQRPHPKGTPAPKRTHPKLNQALPQGFNQLTIQTVPTVAGAKFAFAGATITTDGNGIATMFITPAQRMLIRDNRVRNSLVGSRTASTGPVWSRRLPPSRRNT
jgi:hypothetical protein